MDTNDITTLQARISQLQEDRVQKIKDYVADNLPRFNAVSYNWLDKHGYMTHDLKKVYQQAEQYAPPTGFWGKMLYKHTYEDMLALDKLLTEAREILTDTLDNSDFENIELRAARAEMRALTNKAMEEKRARDAAAVRTSNFAKPTARPPAPAPKATPKKPPARPTYPRQNNGGARSQPSRVPTPTHHYYDQSSGYYYDDDFYQQNTNNALFNFLILETWFNSNNQPVYQMPNTSMYVDQYGNPVDPALVDSGQYSTTPPSDGTTDGTWPAQDTSTTDYSTAQPIQNDTPDGVWSAGTTDDYGASSFS